jgi:hypothetical protein
MNYQRKDLATGSSIGPPAPLPSELVALTDDTLADGRSGARLQGPGRSLEINDLVRSALRL